MDNITILSSEEYTTEVLASEALRHRLYVSGWSLRDELKVAEYCGAGIGIRLAILDNTPIGVALYSSETNEVMTFVRKCHRRKGIGRALVKSFDFKYTPRTGLGIIGSLEFWDSCFHS